MLSLSVLGQLPRWGEKTGNNYEKLAKSFTLGCFFYGMEVLWVTHRRNENKISLWDTTGQTVSRYPSERSEEELKGHPIRYLRWRLSWRVAVSLSGGGGTLSASKTLDVKRRITDVLLKLCFSNFIIYISLLELVQYVWVTCWVRLLFLLGKITFSLQQMRS